MIWVSVGIAISVGIYITHDIKCLWFFVIPALMEVRTQKDDDVESVSK